jgi:hypothetical protein
MSSHRSSLEVQYLEGSIHAQGNRPLVVRRDPATNRVLHGLTLPGQKPRRIAPSGPLVLLHSWANVCEWTSLSLSAARRHRQHPAVGQQVVDSAGRVRAHPVEDIAEAGEAAFLLGADAGLVSCAVRVATITDMEPEPHQAVQSRDQAAWLVTNQRRRSHVGQSWTSVVNSTTRSGRGRTLHYGMAMLLEAMVVPGVSRPSSSISQALPTYIFLTQIFRSLRARNSYPLSLKPTRTRCSGRPPRGPRARRLRH